MKQLENWINYRKSMFSPTELQLILRGFKCTRNQSFRLNFLKQQQLNIPYKITKVDWYQHGYIINDKVSINQIQKTSQFLDAHILLQSLSSMIPAIILNPKSNERVLDMCASPGSKSIQLLEMGANVLANEIDYKRYSKLGLNVSRAVPENLKSKIQLNRADGRFLDLPQFDKILLDAPCSGEGIFSIKEPWTINYWSPNIVSKNSKLQKQLLTNAYKLLKPGGKLVYSTCTLGTEENEDNVYWFLENYPVVLENIDLKLMGSNILRGRDVGNQTMQQTLRILPDSKYEGFFIAKFKKL